MLFLKKSIPRSTERNFTKDEATVRYLTKDEVRQAMRAKNGTPPKEGDKIDFLNDRVTDKGPAAGIVTGVKATVDGYMLHVKHSDVERWLSWEDMREGATKKGNTWLIKAQSGLGMEPVKQVLFSDDECRAAYEAKFHKVRPDVSYEEWRKTYRGQKSDATNMTKALPDPASLPRTKWHGLTLAIENKAGTTRSGKKPDGSMWHTKMKHDYGFVDHSGGVDGDEVDCFVGPDAGAKDVYVVHQKTVDDWEKFDEDKCMLNFASLAAAKQAFLDNYDDPRFLGPITTMPVAEFVKKVRATKEKPAMIKGIFIKSDQLSASMRAKIGTVGSAKREDEPEDVFLEPGSRKYPVKTKVDGVWKYSPKLLEAAAARARMEGRTDLATRASQILSNSNEKPAMTKSRMIIFKQ